MMTVCTCVRTDDDWLRELELDLRGCFRGLVEPLALSIRHNLKGFLVLQNADSGETKHPMSEGDASGRWNDRNPVTPRD